MAKSSFSLNSLSQRLADEESAYKFLEDMRWPDGPVCPHCGNDKAYFLTPKNGATRASGPKRTMSPRRVWKCAKCRKQFSVLTKTIMHGTKVSVRTWVLVFVEMTSAKNGISAREVQRKYDVSAEAAWFMCHRIREAMKRDPLAGLLHGTILADETFIGGKDKNKHAHKRSGRGQTMQTKTAVVSLLNRETGEVRSEVTQFVAGPDLRRVITNHVDPVGSALHTDSYGGYNSVGPDFAKHETVNHHDGEYVRGDVTTNHVEGYFSQLKRSIDGTHHRVTVEHLPRYLAQFDYLYSTRKLDDAARLGRLIGQVGGKRLTYRPLTARDDR
jgi:transposase-like protein